jgi:hypothetical protein
VAARTQELRVHGVGGSHGPRILGFDSNQDIVIVGEGVGGTSVFARRNDPSVESYDWGNLTSGTGSKPFWVFLLPFTLINLAGWMHPPEGRAPPWLIQSIRGLVHLLSALLTAMYVFTFAIILVDIAGYQWTRRLADPAGEIVWQQKVGVGLGLLVLLGVIAALVYTAGTSQTQFEQQPLSALQDMDRPGGEPWKPGERLSWQGFFFHPLAARRRFRAHLLIAVVCWLLVCGLALYRALGGPYRANLQPLDLHDLLSVCSGIAYVAVALLWLTSFGAKRRPRERWTRAGPAIAATLAFGLVNAVVSGTILLLIKQLNKLPNNLKNPAPLKPGPEVNLVDVWGGLALGFVVAAIVLGVIVIFKPLAGTEDVQPDRSTGPGCEVDGLPPSMRKPLARARFLAILAKRGWVIALLVSLSIYLVGLASVSLRIEWTPFPELPAPSDKTGSWLYQVGAYVLPALALVIVQVVRKGRKGARTFASTLWDVFTFWPRRFSPLAVRPYSERAVPELQGRILHHTKDKEEPCPLVLAVHSQGSILAFAALSPLSAEQLQRVALVTYGCPVSSIYAMFFPAYFGPEEVTALRDKLPKLPGGLAGWRNLYRRTDPIGGPVFADTDTPEFDTEVLDPFRGPATDLADTTPPRERDAAPWLRVSGHSYYEQEPALKDWVRRVRLALDPPE